MIQMTSKAALWSRERRRSRAVCQLDNPAKWTRSPVKNFLPLWPPANTLRAMNKLLLVILAILLPPLAVYLKTSSGKTTVLSIVLCFFFWIPGVIHALWVVLK
jgi:uncharacterized membrane protein YqaE (UPF0057 family)